MRRLDVTDRAEVAAFAPAAVAEFGRIDVSCATKFAVRAIWSGLRQENDRIRLTNVCPGVVGSELAKSIADQATRAVMAHCRAVALKPYAIGRAILHAIIPPADVGTTEIIVRLAGNPA